MYNVTFDYNSVLGLLHCGWLWVMLLMFCRHTPLPSFSGMKPVSSWVVVYIYSIQSYWKGMMEEGIKWELVPCPGHFHHSFSKQHTAVGYSATHFDLKVEAVCTSEISASSTTTECSRRTKLMSINDHYQGLKSVMLLLLFCIKTILIHQNPP